MNWRFRDFYFGDNSAEAEADKNQDLLKDGFVDLGGYSTELLSGHRFLILGGKGTGKSALAYHLYLSRDSNTYVHIVNLKTDLYPDLLTIAKGQQNQLPNAWTWLLLVSLFASFNKAGGNIQDQQDLSHFRQLLDATGLLPSDPSDLETLVRASRRKQFSEQLRQRFQVQLNVEGNRGPGNETIPSEFHLKLLVSRLEEALCRFKSGTRHLLIIDDTDKVRDLDGKLDQGLLISLGDLIEQSANLNRTFRNAGVKAKVIVLCRTELFDRISGPTMNRYRQDYSIELTWYSPEAHTSPLWSVADQRALIQCGEKIDILDTFFPKEILGRKGHNDIGSCQGNQLLQASTY